MSKLNKIQLNSQERKELKKGYRYGENHSFRLRCQIILLKNERWRSCDVASVLFCGEQSVNFWVNRYKQEGIFGLQTRSPKRCLQ